MITVEYTHPIVKLLIPPGKGMRSRSLRPGQFHDRHDRQVVRFEVGSDDPVHDPDGRRDQRVVDRHAEYLGDAEDRPGGMKSEAPPGRHRAWLRRGV